MGTFGQTPEAWTSTGSKSSGEIFTADASDATLIPNPKSDEGSNWEERVTWDIKGRGFVGKL